MKFRRVLTAAALAAALTLTGCAASSGNAAPANTTLTLANTLEPISWDPAESLGGDPLQYYQTVYDTLIRRTPDGEFVPMLAKSWEYDDAGLVLSLELRDDVDFSDGEHFNAEAVKANVEHIKSGPAAIASLFSRMVSAEVTGEYSIDITLSEPEPMLINSLSNLAGLMGSPKALGTEDIKTKPVGTGPYLMDSSKTTIGSQYTFVKNEDYWAPDLQHYDTIVIKPIADATARLNALVSGQIDATRLDAKQMKQAESAGMVPHLQELDWLGFTFFDRAGELSPALGDARVRQAINYAIDKESILTKIFQDQGTLTSQTFGPTSTAYVEGLEDAYAYDPDRARELIKESGFTDIVIDTPVLTTDDPALTAVVTEQLAAVGITLNVKSIAPADLASEVLGGKYPILMWSMGQSSTWTTIRTHIAPDAALNLRHSTDPKVSQLISEIQYGDEDAAEEKAQELNEYLVEQAWYAPWFRLQFPYYSNKKVDVELNTEQGVPFIYSYKPAT